MRSIFFFYGIAIRIAALFNEKARLWASGRKSLFSELEKKFSANVRPVAWFHCASLGEFEQGRPLMENFRKKFPDHLILLTFFSPSGYEIRKKYDGADVVSYLPLDTQRKAERFIRIVNPSLVVFIKYEFWLNFLSVLRRKKIKHYLVSAIFRNDQVFFKWYGNIFREALRGFSHVFTQEKKSVELLNSIHVSQLTVAGDTRFDRVVSIAEVFKEIPLAENFSGPSKKVLVAGSTWPADEEKLFPAIKNLLHSGWKMIIAPHETGKDHIDSIEMNLVKNGVAENEMIRFSNADEKNISGKKILVIDNVGMLSSLYHYGKIAYVGGGFGKSIHNILEAAVYGMPVIFGPYHEKFHEAISLLESGGAFCVNDISDLKKLFEKLAGDEYFLTSSSLIAKEYVEKNKGATVKIIGEITSSLNR
ncbi:MAG: 3-deoxy-D-manno-octulosonic acid transferase [Bacteroidetes bacterium]|nr:3-deoxy-D-manno-octulosonic acid transferase [Bacteroidota bacterium]